MTAGRGSVTRPCSKATAEAKSNSPGRNKEIGILRPPKPLVADDKSFADHNLAGGERLPDRRQQRPRKVVGDTDPVIATAERPVCTAFEVGLDDFAARSDQRQQSRSVAFDRADGKAQSSNGRT